CRSLIPPEASIGLWCGHESERADRRSDRQRVDRKRRDRRGIADMPGCAEEAALARIGRGEAHPPVARVRVRARTVGIETRADSDRTDSVRYIAGYRPSGTDDVRQRLQRLDDGQIVRRMHGGRRRVRDEIEGSGRRTLTVELGEEGR